MPAPRPVAVLVCALSVAACADPPPPCTAYQTKQFSEEAFAAIEKGMTRAEVYERIGPGIAERSRDRGEMWFYGDPREADEPFPVVVFEEGKVVSVSRTDRVAVGMDRAAVEAALGKPKKRRSGGRLTLIDYTAPGTCPAYEAREVALGPDDRVAWTWRGWIETEYPTDPIETVPAEDAPAAP